jgi:cysteine desulfurase
MTVTMKHQGTKRIYLDHAAATPIDPEVFSAMEPWLKNSFHNPNALYEPARRARQAIEEARTTVATALSARPQEIIFCDGGTEANNLAIQGVITAWKKNNPNKKAHIITSAIEHSSVYELYKALEEDCDVDYLSVDERGLINIKELKELIREETVIVSVAYANGETGIIQDVKGITKVLRHYKKHNDSVYPYFHTGTEVSPLYFGGDQEKGMRPGTENVPYIVGLATALELSQENSEGESQRLAELQQYMLDEISNSPECDSVIVNSGSGDNYLPNIVNLTFKDLSSEEIVIRLDALGVDCAMRSACTSGGDGDSHVILAMRKEDTGSVRFSMGRGTSREDIDTFLQRLKKVIVSLEETKAIFT